MTRLEKIVSHLQLKGGQCVDTIVTEPFTEMIFRHLVPSVRVRLYQGGGLEILFTRELCPGMNRNAFDKIPEMDWVLQTIDEECKPQPDIESVKA